MAKAPLNIPERKDRVRLRGRDRVGILDRLDDQTLWATVTWDDTNSQMTVHLWELEKEAKEL
jgi:hypothetical protein